MYGRAFFSVDDPGDSIFMDMLSLSLQQARLIGLNLPIKIVEGD